MSERQIRRDVIWNAAGSFVYALASMVLAFLVIRLAGEDEGGIFGFGFSTLGQQMFIIAYFGIRPFQITDTSGEYSFGDYYRLRWITSGLAVLTAALYIGCMWAGGSYQSYKAFLLILLAAYKIIDGFADVYESELQRQKLLYRSGQSLCFRTLLSVAALILMLVFSDSLELALCCAVAAQLAGLYLFSVRPLRSAAETVRDSRSRRVAQLCRSTVLLFLSAFLDFYIFSASKYAVDANMNNAASGFYNILFMPTSLIYLLANFMIRPMLTRLAEHYQSGRQEAFRRDCRMLQLSVSGLGAVILLGAILLGRWGLGICELLLGSTYQGRLTAELGAFLLIIAGGACYALANVQYYILVTLRRQKSIFAVYGSVCVLAFLLAPYFVRADGLRGAAACYLLLMLLLLLGFSVSMRQSAAAEENRKEANEKNS